MGLYRVSRNLEASIIEYLEDQLTGSWSNVSVEKSFSRVYTLILPVICVRCGTTDHERVEIGGKATIRTPSILIDIFTTSDGQRLDLKDFIIEKLKGGIPYYNYTIVNGEIDSKTENGRIRVLDIDDDPIDFDIDKEKLEVHDRFRHLLTLTISLGKVEA